MTIRQPEIKLRPDLVRNQTWAGSKQMWVLKDPMSRTYAYFDETEYAMLCLADGTRSIDQLVVDCQTLLAPDPITADTIGRFYSSAHAAGIVLIDGLAYLDENGSKRGWWRNPLAIRVPGINPDRLLDRFAPLAKSLLSPWSVASAAALMLAATGIAIAHFTDLTSDLSIASNHLMSGQGLVWLMVIVSITKIIHELAHAVTCKFFGGDVLEMGLMLFVGVPCLYCDVSDTWLLPQRWKRILVSAAGMLAELTIAAVATIIWLFASDGLVKDLSVMVMVVCSVSTLFFNGNPLLRYDGYFILSDLVGVPNLAAESSAQIRSWSRWLFWGIRPSTQRPLLGVYGIASGIYRIGLYGTIAWLMLQVADRYDLDRPYTALLSLALVAIAWRMIRAAVLTPPSTEGASHKRPFAAATGLGMLLLIVALIPLPQSVHAPMLIEPANMNPIVVTRPGRIVQTMQAGQPVTAGTVIAQIENAETQRNLIAGRAVRDRLRVQVETLQQSRTIGRVNSAEIESLQRQLAAANKRLRLLERNAEELNLKSPHSGQIFLARRRDASAVDPTAPTWTGTPLDRSNRGAWLDTGVMVCQVGDADQRQAVVMLNQQQIDLVELGQAVEIRLADRHHGAVGGRVIRISTSPAEQIADELTLGASAEVTESPQYLVRVMLDHGTIPVRITGRAKIYVNAESIAVRIGRFLADTFG